MVSFKLFIDAIHRAISQTSNSLIDKNEEFLDRYFTKKVQKDTEGIENEILSPKSIHMSYPILDDNGNVIKSEIQVPLLTIVPVCATKIEKATLTSEFGLDVEEDEVQINFVDPTQHKDNIAYGKVEIIISPQDPPKGLDLLVNAYNNILRRQIP